MVSTKKKKQSREENMKYMVTGELLGCTGKASLRSDLCCFRRVRVLVKRVFRGRGFWTTNAKALRWKYGRLFTESLIIHALLVFFYIAVQYGWLILDMFY